MSTFICEKCGRISNSALRGTYWHAEMNLSHISKGEPIDKSYKPEYEFFETHHCCDKCADGVEFKDGSGVLHPTEFTIPDNEMKHWSEIGKEECLRLEAKGYGFLVNATYFFENGFDEATMIEQKDSKIGEINYCN